jgi:hypothetical protein
MAAAFALLAGAFALLLGALPRRVRSAVPAHVEDPTEIA